MRAECKDEKLRKRQKLLAYRDVVTRRLKKHARKSLCSSLAAGLDLYPDQEAYVALLPFKERLCELFIVSACTLHEPGTAADVKTEKGLGVVVSTAPGQKCERCWMIHPRVGSDSEHPEICPRCVENLKG